MYKIQVTSRGEEIFDVSAGGHTFTVDSKGTHITPLDTFLSGLGTCVGVYLRRYIEGAKLGIKDFSLTVEAELDKVHPVCFKVITVSLDLKGALLDERRKQAMLEFIRNCPAHNTLTFNPAINIAIVGAVV